MYGGQSAFFWYVARLWHDSYYELNCATSKCMCLNPGFQYLMCCCAMLSCPVPSNSLWPQGLQLARLLCPWDSPGKNTGVGCHALLQEIFSTQALNPGLPHCRRILYQLNYQGSSTVLHAVTLFENMITEDDKMSSYWRRGVCLNQNDGGPYKNVKSGRRHMKGKHHVKTKAMMEVTDLYVKKCQLPASHWKPGEQHRTDSSSGPSWRTTTNILILNCKITFYFLNYWALLYFVIASLVN